MARDAAATAVRLVDAGFALAVQGLAGLTVDRVTATAGVAKGTFYLHFRDRASYLVALHAAFHDRIAAAIAQSTADLEPGAKRLAAGLREYLDRCLREPALKALLLDARSEPAMREAVATRNAAFARGAEADLRAMGSAHAAATARLVVAAAAETALIELERGRAAPAARAALGALVGVVL